MKLLVTEREGCLWLWESLLVLFFSFSTWIRCARMCVNLKIELFKKKWGGGSGSTGGGVVGDKIV